MLLSEAISATSFAAGANSIDIFGTQNIDQQLLQTSGEWPAERPNPDWRHSDLKNVSFPYVHTFFDRIVETGNLK